MPPASCTENYRGISVLRQVLLRQAVNTPSWQRTQSLRTWHMRSLHVFNPLHVAISSETRQPAIRSCGEPTKEDVHAVSCRSSPRLFFPAFPLRTKPHYRQNTCCQQSQQVDSQPAPYNNNTRRTRRAFDLATAHILPLERYVHQKDKPMRERAPPPPLRNGRFETLTPDVAEHVATTKT